MHPCPLVHLALKHPVYEGCKDFCTSVLSRLLRRTVFVLSSCDDEEGTRAAGSKESMVRPTPVRRAVRGDAGRGPCVAEPAVQQETLLPGEHPLVCDQVEAVGEAVANSQRAADLPPPPVQFSPGCVAPNGAGPGVNLGGGVC